MKILFISDNFPPEVNAPATRTYEHCREWVKQGAEVTVITCAPNFPQGKLYTGYRNRLYQTEIIDGIKVVRVWSFIVSNAGFAKRILDYLSFAFMAFWAGLFKKTDVIVATSPQFFATFTGFALSIFKRRPWVFELRDLWPESIVTVGAMKRGLAIKTLEKIERFMYRQADLVVAVTPAFKSRLIEYGILEEKVVVVTNGANLEHFSPRPPDKELIEKLNLEGTFVVGYIGTHGMAHGLDFVVETIADLGHQLPSLRFLCIGDGAQKQQVINYAQSLNCSNVVFLDPITKEDVPRYLSALSTVIVPLRKSDTFKTVIPSKIFEACAMQKPILLGVDGQAREVLEHYGAGIFFEPENPESLTEALLLMANDKENYKKAEGGCDALAKQFDRVKLANEMLTALSTLKR